MKKKLLALALSAVLTAGALAGCGTSAKEKSSADTQSAAEQSVTEENTESTDDTQIRLGGLKGPTSMGMAKLIQDASNGESDLNVDFTLAASADELTPAFVQGNLDIMAVPSNLASVLYNKTEGKAQVLAVNTLGVLYIVDTGDSVKSLSDLKGKTIYATGQGATPEYSLKYLLKENGLDPENDVTIEWKSEPTEIVSEMAASSDEVIAMLPQPFVTVAQSQVEGLNVAVNLNDEWNALDNGSSLVTGVVVVRSEFAKEHPQLVSEFMDAYQASTEFANNHVEEVSSMIEDLDIVKAPIAQKAIPQCNITYMEGSSMKDALSGYLEVLYEQNPASIGGTLPADDFYYER